jgi:hypothetical protein
VYPLGIKMKVGPSEASLGHISKLNVLWRLWESGWAGLREPGSTTTGTLRGICVFPRDGPAFWQRKPVSSTLSVVDRTPVILAVEDQGDGVMAFERGRDRDTGDQRPQHSHGAVFWASLWRVASRIRPFVPVNSCRWHQRI